MPERLEDSRLKRWGKFSEPRRLQNAGSTLSPESARTGRRLLRVNKIGINRQLAAACIIAVGFLFLTAVYWFSLTDAGAAKRDFIGYWAAGRQMVHGADPFD